MRIFFQSIVLIASFALVYIWQNSFLALYTIPALGFLIFMYLLVTAKKKGKISFKSNILGIFSLNTVILLLISSTGGLSSSIFFLLYFLAFGIAFILEPSVIFIFTIGVFAVFFPQAIKNEVMDNFLKLGSLGLVSPLAYFFGREYKERDKEEEKISSSANKISKDVGEVLEKDKKNLDLEDVASLNDARKEAESLRSESEKS